MSRRSIAVLERNLKFARDRATFLARTDRPVKATVDRRPKRVVGYRSSLMKFTAGSVLLQLQASEAGFLFFGGLAGLNLIDNTGVLLADAAAAPRKFKPAQISAVVGDPTPTVKTAQGSRRRYVKYSRLATGEQQASFTAPISLAPATVTTDQQQNAAKLLGASATIVAKLGGTYGRAFFIPEQFTSVIK